nr:response regulator [Burkholderiaceae bacterium]
GQGSCFWVDVPLPAVAHDPQSELDPEPARTLAGAQVLLVEDNALNRLIASMMLKSWGIEVLEAIDGEESLAIVARESGRIDLVLMDIHMPGMSGYETTRHLRQHYDPLELPIVALTAAALASEQARAITAGMNDFVPKPIDVDQLRTVVSRWLRRGALPLNN